MVTFHFNVKYKSDSKFAEEVFEYIEVSQSLVKRRWWAGEQYDDIRTSPSKMIHTNTRDDWRGGDDWMIDCAGGCSFVLGGWESCSNLVGGPSKYFSAKRTFDATHPFRRRRWFRRRIRSAKSKLTSVDGVPILFHQPCNDLNARKITKDIDRSVIGGRDDTSSFDESHYNHRIFLKILDGKWSSSIEIPRVSTAVDGFIRVRGSRWPQLNSKSPRRGEINPVGSPASVPTGQPVSVYNYATLDPSCYELSYRISILDGPWGELTKMLTVYPRFSIRNGSKVHSFDIKQAGAPDSTAISIGVTEIKPFFWSDISLPELICVRPTTCSSNSHLFDRRYKWSGAFDIRKIGMIPLRIREEARSITLNDKDTELFSVKVVRASVEIRPGTGGTGLMVSLHEEKNNGEGALYRIENFSPFPLWVVQDGVLANPHSDYSPDDFTVSGDDLYTSTGGRRKSDSILNGDIVLPSDTIGFGLDIPYRQGKYSWRDAASIDELTRVRISLAPLSSRDGIETTKVIELSTLGESIRLSPSKLRMSLDEDHLKQLLEVKVLGLVYADGPTKVLKFW